MNKFKKWLITKLGGYTVQNIQKYNIVRETRPVVHLRAAAIEEKENFALSYLYNDIKRDLAIQLAEKMQEANLIRFERMDHPSDPRCYKIMADIYVAHGDGDVSI